MGNIKSRLVLECSDDNIFIEFCKCVKNANDYACNRNADTQFNKEN